MSTTYIPAELRRLVTERAEHLCEYCLIHEDDTFFGCQVDHIISEKHGGPTQEGNLAYACLFCNRYKGSDVGSIIPGIGEFTRFFNPRMDRWNDHFALDSDGITLQALTDIGEATARIFEFNHRDRLLERQTLHAIDRYPTEAARHRMNRAT